MDNFCICGQAISTERFKVALLKSQRALIEQGYEGAFLSYVGLLPKGCPPHPDPNHHYVERSGCVPYAFKAYMMKEAQSLGFRYVGYLDSIIYLQKPFKVISDIVQEHGYFLGENGADLGLYTSDACLDFFTMTREEVLGKNCIHGGIMFLDLQVEKCRLFLDEMFRLAFPDGPYCANWKNEHLEVSKDPKVKGHRPHQSVATILAMRLGLSHWVPYSLTYEQNKPQFIFHMMSKEEIDWKKESSISHLIETMIT